MRLAILTAAAAALLIGAGPVAAQQPASGANAAAMPSPTALIRQWDTDHDGTVSKDEWVAAGRSAASFDKIDTNQDGRLNAEELAAAMAGARLRQSLKQQSPKPSPQ